MSKGHRPGVWTPVLAQGGGTLLDLPGLPGELFGQVRDLFGLHPMEGDVGPGDRVGDGPTQDTDVHVALDELRRHVVGQVVDPATGTRVDVNRHPGLPGWTRPTTGRRRPWTPRA